MQSFLRTSPISLGILWLILQKFSYIKRHCVSPTPQPDYLCLRSLPQLTFLSIRTGDQNRQIILRLPQDQ